MAVEVKVERARCIGSKTCISAAPGVFHLDSQRIAVVVDPDAVPTDQVVRAAVNCPTGALSVFEDGEQLA
ncbi:MAG TPA: ferredoxin [Acidimicrobiales bacterium]|jgi:ferredoxin|nr:ferredoxin [Acidimicrobiales bacterium]